MYGDKVVTQIVGLESSTNEHTFYTQRKQQIRLVEEEPTSDPDATTYSQDEVTAFQTKFWVAIVLIIAFFLSTITLFKMDKLENSLIYRSTDAPRPIPDVS